MCRATTTASIRTRRSICTPTRRSPRSTGRSSSASGASSVPTCFRKSSRRRSSSPRAAGPGPVLVSVPMDIFSMEIDIALFERLAHTHARSCTSRRWTRQTAEKIVRDAGRGEEPGRSTPAAACILADAAEELREFVDHLAHPGRAQPDGQGRAARRSSADARHDRLLGHQVHQRQVPQRRLDPRRSARASPRPTAARGRTSTRSASRRRKLIHIDIDPNEIGRNYPGRDRRRHRPEAGARRSCNRVAKRLLSGRPQERRAGQRDRGLPRRVSRRPTRSTSQSAAYPMRPERILAAVREVLPRDAIITTDVGWNKNGVGQQFPIYTPGSILTPGGYATMGFGAPAAIGAKLACPDKVVVALVGDGGFGQNPAMLATAVEQDIAGRLGRHEQQRVRHDRRPGDGALRHDVRLRVPRERRAVLARLRRDRARLRRRRRADQVGRRVQAGAGARDRRRASRSSSTSR